jgi:5-methyltetrahydropteroyltriglutamate--homocysteine methyltransferase
MPSAWEIRADHVGSFLRPAEVLEARRNAGNNPASLRALEDRHIRNVLMRQKDLGSIHLCRGNNRSHWYTEGGYDAIAEKLFGTLDVDRCAPVRSSRFASCPRERRLCWGW